MEENIIKQRSIHKCNFTILHNEILFQKKQNGKAISLDALGLFWRILSLPPQWNLNMSGLMKICGCGKEKLKSCFNELIEAGYLTKSQGNSEINGQFEPNTYYIIETLDKALWNVNNEDEIIDTKNAVVQEDDLPQAGFPATGNPATEKPATGNLPQYNMLNNKENKIIKNDNNLSEKFSDSLKNEPLNNNKQTSLQIPVKNNLNMENQESAKGCEKGSQRGQGTKIKKEQRRELRNQKRQEQIEEALNKPKVSVTELADKPLSEQTPEERTEANCQKLLNEIREERLIAEYKSQKKTGIKKRILAKVDKDIQNQELAVVLKDYLSMWITRGKVMTDEVYNAQLNHLYTITRDPSEQIQIVKTSVQKGWLDLYPLRKDEPFKQNKPNEIYKSKIKQEEIDPEMEELATDENGNPLVF